MFFQDGICAWPESIGDDFAAARGATSVSLDCRTSVAEPRASGNSDEIYGR